MIDFILMIVIGAGIKLPNVIVACVNIMPLLTLPIVMVKYLRTLILLIYPKMVMICIEKL